MKKILLATAVIAGFSGSLSAQHEHNATCGTPNYREALKSMEFASEQAKFNAYHLENGSLPAGEKSLDLRIVPVVVHVIHDGTSASNVSVADINSMMTKINQAFSLSAPNVGNIPEHFDSLALDAKIEFRLATIDPFGNCTDGIRRVYAPYAAVNAHEDKRFKSLSYWDRTKYLNIWIVRNIKEPASTSPGTVLGYAYYPGGAQALKDGPTVSAGSITTQSVAAHEVGHYLNLVHIWGDEPCGSDDVEDTPIHAGENFAWANPCDSSIKEATCYLDFATNQHDSILRYSIGENYQNYMDYVNNYMCPNMFTKGQVTRMRSALDFYSFRFNMWQDANLAATGVADGSPACTSLKPIAEFWADKNIICKGGSVAFSDGSFNGNISAATHTFAWEFEGGTPSTSTAKNPNVTYATPGTYKVKFVVKNAAGDESTKERVEYIKVLDTEVEDKSFGYKEGFEFGEPFLQDKWALSNEPSVEKGWVWTGDASYSGEFSLVCRNIESIRDAKYTAITPTYNMNAIVGSNKKLRFKMAYALRTQSTVAFDEADQSAYAVIADRLIISRSADCGNTWTPIKSFNQAEMISAGVNPNNFVPTEKVEWKAHTINLSGTNATGANVRFKFEFTSGCQFNNNLYIDDIEIFEESALSIDEATAEDLSLSIYPNPVTESSTLRFELPVSVDKVNIVAYDIVGKQVAQIYNGGLASGEHQLNINRSSFGAAGVYFIKINMDGREFTERVVIK